MERKGRTGSLGVSPKSPPLRLKRGWMRGHSPPSGFRHFGAVFTGFLHDQRFRIGSMYIIELD